MIYVSIGGKHKKLGDISQGVQGGSAWGAGNSISQIRLEIKLFKIIFSRHNNWK